MATSNISSELNAVSPGGPIPIPDAPPSIPKVKTDIGEIDLGSLPADISINDKSDKITIADDDSHLLFSVPDWGYQDFIRERTYWQKGLDSITGEPGYFYFKIFFRFDTSSGLFGALLGEEDESGNVNKSTIRDKGDCARRYLEMNEKHYEYGNMNGRAHSLKRFAAILSYINSNAPWFFDSISGLDKASSPNILAPMSPDNIIELGFKEDAVDMRVSTLIDLYKYSVFDYVNMKEVVPENLRLFDMCIVLFHTPIRWYHTGMNTMRRGSFPYKSLSDSNPDNRMSYKMYTFKGCEFVRESLGSIYPSEISNNDPFSIKGKIQIHYKRVYQHSFNEWGQFMIGDDGIYYDASRDSSSSKPSRLLAIEDAHKNPFYFNRGAEVFKALVDVTEQKITWAMRKTDPSFVFGNLYMDDTVTDGSYFNEKLKNFKKGAGYLHREGTLNNIDKRRDVSGKSWARDAFGAVINPIASVFRI